MTDARSAQIRQIGLGAVASLGGNDEQKDHVAWNYLSVYSRIMRSYEKKWQQRDKP